MKGAANILEIGTLSGYSTIWLARALPEHGRLVSLEFEHKHVVVAEDNLRMAGLADKTEIIEGPALDSLALLEARERSRSTSSSLMPTSRTIRIT